MFVVNFGDRVSRGLPTAFRSAPISAASHGPIVGSAGGPDGSLRRDFVLPQYLEKGKCEKKALMLVSDGGDNSSTHGSEEVALMVRESRATIYTIGIFDADDQDRNPALLRRLAQVSGGESFFPAQLSEVVGICRQIASDIRTRYTVGYVPIRSSEQGSLRKIKVTASTPGGHKLAVHTRTSYILPPKALWPARVARRAESGTDETADDLRPMPLGLRSDTSSWLLRSCVSGSTATRILSGCCTKPMKAGNSTGWRIATRCRRRLRDHHAGSAAPGARPEGLWHRRGLRLPVRSSDGFRFQDCIWPPWCAKASIENTLQLAIGHIPGMALPGQAGNVGAGGSPRYVLSRVKGLKDRGRDSILNADGNFTYAVESIVVVEPDDVAVLAASCENVLTLVTCYPFSYIGAAPKQNPLFRG